MNPGVLTNAISSFSGFLLSYAVVLAAAGTLAMALVELLKKLRDTRIRFHARATTRWFMRSGTSRDAEAFGQLLQLAAGISMAVADRRARELLAAKGQLSGILWLTSDCRDAPFALELDQMMACFQDSFDLALSSPKLYRELFDFIADAATPEDREAWLIESDQIPAAVPLAADAMKQRAERYARLRQAAKRKANAFQTFAALRWVNQQQLWANVLGTLILGSAFLFVGVARQEITFAILFSLLGGMLAPVAKDIVVALEQLRRPRA